MNLVKNEVIKLALKGSTQIIAVLLVIISAGMCLLFFIDNNNVYYHDDSYDVFTEYRNNIRYNNEEIERLEHDRPEDWNWEESVEELKINTKKYEFAIESGINISYWSNDWRREYVDYIFGGYRVGGFNITFPEKDAEQIKGFILADDWRGLYTFIVEMQTRAFNDYKILGVNDDMLEIMNFKYVYSLEYDISPAENNWKNGVLSLLTGAKMLISELENGNSDNFGDKMKLDEIKDQAAILQYRLDNNIARTVDYGDSINGMDIAGITGNYIGDMAYIGNYHYNESTREIDVWTMLEGCVGMMPLMSVFIIIIAGGLVASEFTRGTIKFLLINPVKRWKILMSKYVVMLLTAMTFLAAMFTIYFILGGALTGFTNAGAMHLTASGGVVKAVPALVYFVQLYLLGTVNIVVIASLAFALSSLTRNSGLSVAISISALIGSTIIDGILRYQANIDWGRYLIFANADLVSILYGGGMFMPYKGQTLTFSLGVIAVHMVIFILMAWDGFTKKEI
jgi:ABC-2 type transport system permease protein